MGDNLGPKAGAYLNLPDEEHVELYSGIEVRLSIESTSKEAMVGEASSKESARINNLRNQISELERERELDRKEIEGLSIDVTQLKDVVSGLKGYMAMLEEIYEERETLAPDYPIDDKDKTFKKRVEELK